MAFCQLWIAAIALAGRFEDSRVVRVIEREVPRLVAVPMPADAPAAPAEPEPVVVRVPALITEAPPPEPTPVRMPSIADPRAERLVEEARRARVAGDMGLAIVKLEEALVASEGNDATVHYELGLVHEQMGIFETASNHYLKVMSMNLDGAGALYAMAAAKLRDGFQQPSDMLGKLSLGQPRRFHDPHHPSGERVVLDIPVQCAPGEEIDPQNLDVTVLFFNRNHRGEIMPRDEQTVVVDQWISEPLDWATGEETLRMTYTIPPQDAATDHLFGHRSYYGQVVTLHYAEEVMDVAPWPRDLAARMPQSGGGQALGGPWPEDFPLDLDPDGGLLPPLPPSEPGANLPPLPELPPFPEP
jgi:hypothetical protein